MGKVNSYELCEEKIRLLKEYVSTGEEILSSTTSWEALEGILAQRDYLIKKLEQVENNVEESMFVHPSTKAQEKEIDRLVKLILDIDQNAMELIKEEQQKTIDDLKANKQKQRALKYETVGRDTQGKLIDVRK
ncbi:hypothetical protein Q5O24_04495 [Eubacteriaceae bacterium ES3]|nr:hypothetical protein Q5O24_04495 [Eubacteriaceae bacterium ES3]